MMLKAISFFCEASSFGSGDTHRVRLLQLRYPKARICGTIFQVHTGWFGSHTFSINFIRWSKPLMHWNYIYAAEFGSFRCTALLPRHEELNSKAAVQEEGGSQDKDSLDEAGCSQNSSGLMMKIIRPCNRITSLKLLQERNFVPGI